MQPGGPPAAALADLMEPFGRWLAATRDPANRRRVEAVYAVLVPSDARLVVQLRLDGAGVLVQRLARAGLDDAAAAVEEELGRLERELTEGR